MFEFELAQYRDPREIDWTDGLNPQTAPSMCQPRNEAQFSLFQHPSFIAIRNAGTYEMHCRVVPDGTIPTMVAASSSYEDLFSVPAGSFLVAVSCHPYIGGGNISYSIKDLGSGQTLSNKPVKDKSLIPYHPENLFYQFTAQNWLDKPWPISKGNLAVSISNYNTVGVNAQIVLWIVSPSLEMDRIPNAYDAQLQAETNASLSTPRALAGLGDTPSDGTEYRIMPLSGKPFSYLSTAPVVAQYGTKTITSFRVPQHTRAAITAVKAYYNGAGFLDGDGGLTWQITADNFTAANGFEAMNTQLGRNSWEPLAGPITGQPGQLIEYKVTAAADLTGTVTCGLQGFFYPA